MTQRAVNRKGWGSQDTFDVAELNGVYTHGSFWVPAGSLTPNAAQPPTLTTLQMPTNNYSTYTVLEYVHTADKEAFFTWAFKSDFMKVPSASLLLKVAPLWTTTTTAAAPNNVVGWQSSAFNTIIGATLDFNNAPNEVDLDQVTPTTARDLQGGKTADDEASLALTVYNSVVSGSDWNHINILMERNISGGNDTFAASVYLLGVGVQFAVDFNNVAVWPT